MGEEIFGLDEFYDTDDYYDSSNSSTESKRPITVLLTIGGQVDHECDDEHVMGEDGKCYKVESHFDVEEALNYLKKQARSCLKCIASYIFYDYTDAEGNEEEYTDFEEIFEKRTMKFPKWIMLWVYHTKICDFVMNIFDSESYYSNLKGFTFTIIQK